jgi:hypothetical protein
MALLGGYLCWDIGHNGIFLLDQSMVFDSGWRILSGQVPYRDFGMPFGPLTSLLQSAAFAIGGVNWHASVAPAVLIHILATPTIWHIQRVFFQGKTKLPAWIAAASSAFFFYTPFGTLWFELSGVFFVLLSMLALMAGPKEGTRRKLWDIIAGALFFTTFLCKQNVALFYTPLPLAILFCRPFGLRNRINSLVHFALGNLALLSICIGTAALLNSLMESWFYLIMLPREIALARASVQGLPMGFHLFPTSLAAASAAISGLTILIHFRSANQQPELFQIGLICIIQTTCWLLTLLSTANEYVLFAFGAGLLLANMLGQILLLIQPWIADKANANSLKRQGVQLGFFCTSALILTLFMTTTWPMISGRIVQQFQPGTKFEQTLKISGLEGLRWGEPTIAKRIDTNAEQWIEASHLEQVVQFLRRQNSNFYVWGDTTLLYGLLRRASPPPLLYFGANHSYLRKDTKKLDLQFQSSLENAKIGFIVKEVALHTPKGVNDLNDFPLTRDWIQTNFQPAHEWGIYQVWERRRQPLER